MNAFSKITSQLLGEDGEFEAQEIKARKSSNIILWSIAAFTVRAVIWAALTTVERTVRATGRVVPSSKLQVVSNLEGGVVEEILVKEGEKGDKWLQSEIHRDLNYFFPWRKGEEAPEDPERIVDFDTVLGEVVRLTFKVRVRVRSELSIKRIQTQYKHQVSLVH